MCMCMYMYLVFGTVRIVYVKSHTKHKLKTLKKTGVTGWSNSLHMRDGANHMITSHRTFCNQCTSEHTECDSRYLYMVAHLLADWVKLTLIWDVPPSCLAGLGRIEMQVRPNQVQRQFLFCVWFGVPNFGYPVVKRYFFHILKILFVVWFWFADPHFLYRS